MNKLYKLQLICRRQFIIVEFANVKLNLNKLDYIIFILYNKITKGRDFMNKIENLVCNYPKLQLIDISKIYYNKFSNMSEQAFYKTISRLNKTGKLCRIAKGIYCVPQITKYGVLISSENEIIDYYSGTNSGVLVGYTLYNKYGISTQISKSIEMYSNILYENKKTVSNISIKRVNIKFTKNNISMVELLEILENYKKIEDINYRMLNDALKNLAKNYNEKSFNTVIKNIKYKKSTLASLKYLLDFYNIENNIQQHLRKTSKYKIIDLEKIYELAS